MKPWEKYSQPAAQPQVQLKPWEKYQADTTTTVTEPPIEQVQPEPRKGYLKRSTEFYTQDVPEIVKGVAQRTRERDVRVFEPTVLGEAVVEKTGATGAGAQIIRDVAGTPERITRVAGGVAGTVGEVPGALISLGLKAADVHTGGRVDKTIEKLGEKIVESDPVKNLIKWWDGLSNAEKANYETAIDLTEALGWKAGGKVTDIIEGARKKVVTKLKPTIIDDVTLSDITKGKVDKIVQPSGDIASATKIKQPGIPFAKDLSVAETRIMKEVKAPETISFRKYAKQSALAAGDTRSINPQQLAATNATKAFKEIDEMRGIAGKQIDDIIKNNPGAQVDISNIKNDYYRMVESRLGIKPKKSEIPIILDKSGKPFPKAKIPPSVISDPSAMPIHNDIVATFKALPDVIDAKTAAALKQNLRSKLKYDVGGQLRAPNSKMAAIQKNISSQIDKKLDSVLDGYKKANAQYGRTAKLENAFSKALGEEFTVGSGLTKHGASIMKRALQSTADSNIGDIFREVKRVTGGKYDLFQDASYATIAMRLSGDANQVRKATPFGDLVKPGGKGGDVAAGIKKAVDIAGAGREKVTGGRLQRILKWYEKQHKNKPDVEIRKIDKNLLPAAGLGTSNLLFRGLPQDED